MDLTDTPDVRAADEDPPDFSEWEAPETVLKEQPTRERMLDAILQLRTPTTVSDVAELAACDTETARDYLEWFASMGMVREFAGRPVRYERNDSYLRWRRVEGIRRAYSEAEIVEELASVVEELAAYRSRFDADSPDDVSLLDASHGLSIEAAWEAVSEWKTLERRATLLDDARRDTGSPRGGVDLADS